MGLFDALFGGQKPTKVEVAAESIWMTKDAKFAGLAKEIAERANSETVAILVVAHFPDVLNRLKQLVSQPTKVPVMAVLASDLSTKIATSLNLDTAATIDILVAERHPLRSVDERLEEFAGELPCRCRFAHHVSLDDPIIRIFAGDWMQSLLEKLGMQEDEAMESNMVSRRIQQAQQKIERQAVGSSAAESAESWLEKNCPELTNK